MVADRIYASRARVERLRRLSNERRKQYGIEFPKAGVQQHVLIARLDLSPVSSDDRPNLTSTRSPHQTSLSSSDKNNARLRLHVQKGLKNLCSLFDDIQSGKKMVSKLGTDGKMLQVDLNSFNFTACLGFGIGFFEKLGIPIHARPKRIKSLPDNLGLGDIIPYTLAQTDLIIQLGSSNDAVNRWVFENKIESNQIKNHIKDAGDNEHDIKGCSPDIVTAIRGWATVVDFHLGFQRLDGRNLLGFNDGVSNPNPGSGDKFDLVVWTTEEDEGPILKDGSYMVFLKIAHDLDQWRALTSREQEEWVGRSKSTGLLLGTRENDDKRFIDSLENGDPVAQEKLRKLIEDQSDPEKPFYDQENFKNNVPAWSHVRKANPRTERILPGGKRLERRLIFRRGYLFTEAGLNNKVMSGLLFISYQRDIENSFEFIKKNWLNGKKFPTPGIRRFTRQETNSRRSHGCFTPEELEELKRDNLGNQYFGLDDRYTLIDKTKESKDDDTQETGKEGLAGPSKLGIIPRGDFLATIPYGGGYYFLPPIPDRSIKDIGQQFFNF